MPELPVDETVARDLRVLVLEFEDGRKVRFRYIRKFGRVGVAGRSATTGDLEGELGGTQGPPRCRLVADPG